LCKPVPANIKNTGHKVNQMSIYFGGSRSLASSEILASVTHAVLLSGQSVHVGCQLGADRQVVNYTVNCYSGQYASSLVVFAVMGMGEIPNDLQVARVMGARVISYAGGTSAPIKARYLLRSIAAFQGCDQAVFFSPGAGSLAVARECVKSGLPVFAFQEQAPAAIPSTAGQWQQSSFMGFQCWQWASAQQSLF
jgi:hypothetical protein